MELAVPCTICKSKTACDCKRALVSFFEILERTQTRILSLKVTSKASDLPMAKAGIDKLNAYFPEAVEISKVIELAKTHNIEFKKVRLKNKWHLKLSRNNYVLHLPLNITQEMVTGLVSNPNNFENWSSYLAFIESILSPEVIQMAQIHRLDLNIDFSLAFTDLIQKIDVKNKSTAARHDDKGGYRTGLTIGKNPELIVIYDKTKKESLSVPLSRIELRLSSKKVPCRSIYDVPKSVQSNIHFAKLEGYDLSFNEIMLNDAQKQRLQEFKALLKRDGLYSARKSMSKSRNFDRDFNKILKTTKWTTPLSEVYSGGIKRFLGVE